MLKLALHSYVGRARGFPFVTETWMNDFLVPKKIYVDHSVGMDKPEIFTLPFKM